MARIAGGRFPGVLEVRALGPLLLALRLNKPDRGVSGYWRNRCERSAGRLYLEASFIWGILGDVY
jgi:hypothetical protein